MNEKRRNVFASLFYCLYLRTRHAVSLLLIPTHSVYSYALTSSKVQATFKQENSHKPTPTLSGYF